MNATLIMKLIIFVSCCIAISKSSIIISYLPQPINQNPKPQSQSLSQNTTDKTNKLKAKLFSFSFSRMQGYNYDNYRDYNIRQQRPPMQYNYRNSQQSQQPSREENQIAPPSQSPSSQRPLESPSSSSLDMKNVINRIKFVWDIFVAMNSAWNSVAQQQTKYIKDPKFNMTAGSSSTTKSVDSNLPTNFRKAAVKNSKGKSTIPPETSTTSTSTTPPTPDDAISVGENDADDVDGDQDARKKRDSENAVGEARYIKGDPLKGYYDFVITEGSYKFWAAFQVRFLLLLLHVCSNKH